MIIVGGGILFIAAHNRRPQLYLHKLSEIPGQFSFGVCGHSPARKRNLCQGDFTRLLTKAIEFSRGEIVRVHMKQIASENFISANKEFYHIQLVNSRLQAY